MFVGHLGRDVNVSGVRHDNNSRKNNQHCSISCSGQDTKATQWWWQYRDEIVRLSEIKANVESDEQLQEVLDAAIFGEVYITKEKFACEWPLGDAITIRQGDPKASELAPILAPWSLLEDALKKFANKQ